MKNKKVTYALLIAAFIIWGAVGWKIIVHFTGDDRNDADLYTPRIITGTDSSNIHFTLVADYRDPFLSSQRKVRPVRTNVQTEIKPTNTRRTTTGRSISRRARVRWPAIQYGGVIQNKKSSTRTVLVKINNYDYLMSEGMIIKDVKLLRIYEDSIQLVYKEETKGFPKIK